MSPEDAVRILLQPSAHSDNEHTLAKHTIGSCTLAEYNQALTAAGASPTDIETSKAKRRSWRNTEYQKAARRKQAVVSQASLSNATDALHEHMLDNLSNYGWRDDHNMWLQYGFISFIAE